MKVLKPAGLLSAKPLLVHLTLRENRSKYKRSALGWAWSMVNPLATMLIFTFVFRVILKITPPSGNPSGLNNFSLFLISALLPWNFLANGLGSATGSILSNEGLIKKVYFPRAVLPAATIFSWDTNLLIEFGVLSIALLIFGQVVFPLLPIALFVIALQTVLVLGLGTALAALNVYFRDVQHFLSIVLLMWFYSTPILYPITLVPESKVIGGMDVPVRGLYNLNPMVHFTEAYRNIFYDLKIPGAKEFLYMAVSAALSMVVGMAVFKRLEPKFAEEL
ncbi:MAG: ABC transporter permease [Actinomycetota bacterium]